MIRSQMGPAQYRMPVSRPTKTPPPESISWWWHPSRPGVEFGPSSFRNKLQEIDPQLDVTHDKYKDRYNIWVKKPTVQHRLCWGWNLLFTVHPSELDERQFARLYSASARVWGNAQKYFEAWEREQKREKEAEEKRYQHERNAEAAEYFDHTKIQVGYGANNGSKFQKYHSGLG